MFHHHPPARSRLGSTWSRLALVVALLVPVLAGLPGAERAAAQEVPELKVNSNRYIVTDAETGEVYAQRNADERVAIGSLTKIFTAIEAIEIAPLDTVITTTEDDLKDPANNSIMGFDAGEELTLEELLYGLMLPSGNDAAHAIARGLGFREGDTDSQQSVDRFMGWINQRVLDMGLVDTFLITPDGWGVPGHYTTAHDLAAFTRYAMSYPFFETLISTAEYTTAEGNAIYNNNRLLGLYPDLIGGKTGYDWDAGWCLVEVAERDGMRMISVTLDGVHENMDWYDDNEVLLEYGFEQRTGTMQAQSAWTGRTALFSDPDVALLDRSAAASGQIGGVPAVAAGTDPNVPTAETGAVAAAVDAGPAAGGETTDVAAETTDASGNGTGTTVARVALVLGLVALVGLAAGVLYTRLAPRRTRLATARTGARQSPDGPERTARPGQPGVSAASRTAQRRAVSPRR